MRKKLNENLIAAFVLLFTLVSCASNDANNSAKKTNIKKETTMTYSKKFTNADFYTDGKFNQEVAMNAFKDMFAAYDVPFTELMAKEMWVTDFGLGDFENLGMGGIFWVNDQEHGYFAHAIYLLPGQMIPEHAHVKTDFSPKFESWMVTKGWAYNFSEIGEETPNPPAIPASHGAIKSKNFVIQNVGAVIHLKKAESYHFLLAGPEGAIIDEWASYHDNVGLRFTNQNASL
jgi:ABC-type sugar transport system, auxiliary component